MMCYLARIIGGAVMLALTATAIAATPPESWFSGQRLALEQLDRTQYAALDLEQLALEDQFNEALGQPPRFAVGREIAISPFNAGTWTETRESSIWRYRVTAEQAVSLNFGFDNVHLPPQARLYIYTVDAALRGEMDRFEVLGPYGPEINESHRQFWTPIVAGDDVVIELNVPHDQRARVLLELVRVNQGYRAFGRAALQYRQQNAILGDGKQNKACGKTGSDGSKSGSCNMDVACLAADDPWNDPRRSVGAYSRNGVAACTGSLLNNTAADQRMLFVTATHCGLDAGAAPSVVVYWNYEWPTCRTPGDPGGTAVNPPDPAETNLGGAFLAATINPFGGNCSIPGECSDMTLIELDDPADPAFDLFWAGWDRRAVPATCGPQGAPGSTDGLCASIHHPGVDEKRITFVEEDFVVGDIAGAQGVHWHSFWHPDPPVVDNIPKPQPGSIPPGVTEPGSSGSPLYTAEQRLVGVLSGGPAACGATGANLSDFYGQLAHAWDGLGTSSTRMRDHLDPTGLNPDFIDGRGTSPFDLELQPALLAVCASAGSVDVDISVQADAGFSDPVMLSLTDAPPGATSSFSTNPVVPPGSSLLTFGSLGNATAGDFVVTLTGTSADEAADKALPFTLNDIAPDSVDLLTPADGAGASRQPQLEWSTPTSQGATDFLVEIATDPGFGDIVYSDIVIGEASTIVSAPLESSTEYFWKVTPSNACGTAATSQTFSFITQAAPGDCAPGSAEIVHFTDDIEAGDNGWTHSSIVGPDTWVRQTTDANSPVTAWQSDDVAVISDQRLVSPTIALPETANLLTLQYYAQRGLEDGGAGCFDGGILEYSSDGGQNWSQVGAARLLTNPYTGPIDDGFENPLIGSDAWCGNQGWTRTVVDLAGLEGLDIQFRYRLGTDSSVEADSWRIDDVSVKSCGLEMIFSNGFESPIQVRR